MICAGEEIKDQGKPRRPTIFEQMRAAETLSKKILPDLAASAISGPNGLPVESEETKPSDMEIARRILFVLAAAKQKAESVSNEKASKHEDLSAD